MSAICKLTMKQNAETTEKKQIESRRFYLQSSSVSES